MKFSCEVFAENLTVMHFVVKHILDHHHRAPVVYLSCRQDSIMMTNPAHKAFYCALAKVNYCTTNCEGTAETESIDKVVLVGRRGQNCGQLRTYRSHSSDYAHTPLLSVHTVQIPNAMYTISTQSERVDIYIVQVSIKMYQSGEKVGVAHVLFIRGDARCRSRQRASVQSRVSWVHHINFYCTRVEGR